MKTAVSVIFLVAVAVFGSLRLWEFISGIHPVWAVALNEACVGLILAAVAWWPLATGRRMRMLFGFYTMPPLLQIAFQILLMAGAGWSWWRAAVDVAALR